MIPDWETNRVYFSGLLAKHYPELWQRLANILCKHRVPVRLIDGTRDIWARDYCPIQVAVGRFVKFRYCPDYLHGHKHLVTSGTVSQQFHHMHSCRRSNLILDGGNVVAANGRVILTEKIYRENPRIERSGLRSRLAKLFEVDHCVMIPKEAGDVIGHSDGVVRFVEEDLVVVNDYARVDPAYQERLYRVLAREGLQIRTLPHFRDDRIVDGVPSAVGNYVNFLRVGNLIVVPAYKHRLDDRACRMLEQLCPKATVVPVPCKDLARAGGALNCIGYTVREGKVPK